MTLTTEMIRAGQDVAPQLSAVEIAAVWRAMCAAAPVAAQAQPPRPTVTFEMVRKAEQVLIRGKGPNYRKIVADAIEAALDVAQKDGQFAVPQPVSGADRLPPFAEQIINKLNRIDECASDGQGADIGRHWFDILTQLGLLNRVQLSPALWEITVQGKEVLHGRADRL